MRTPVFITGVHGTASGTSSNARHHSKTGKTHSKNVKIYAKTNMAVRISKQLPRALDRDFTIHKHNPQCNCLRANIEGNSMRRSQTGEVCVMYRIVVGRGENDRMWQVYRRYSEFLTLHQHLTKVLPPSVVNHLKLPAKRYVRKFFEENSDQLKQDALNRYLQTLLSMPATRDLSVVMKFLEVYRKTTTEDFVQIATCGSRHIPQHTATRLYAEYMSPKLNSRPPSCRSMKPEQYKATLTSAVAAAANPRIRLLKQEARADVLETFRENRTAPWPNQTDQQGQLRFNSTGGNGGVLSSSQIQNGSGNVLDMGGGGGGGVSSAVNIGGWGGVDSGDESVPYRIEGSSPATSPPSPPEMNLAEKMAGVSISRVECVKR